MPALGSPAGGLAAACGNPGVDGAVRGWTVFHLPSTPWADDGRPIHILRLGYTRLGLQGSERGSSPPPRRGRDPAAQPRRTPASPQALLARASSRSYFDLAGKILVGSSCMANWMHSWLIGQILLMRRRHHAGFRAGDEFCCKQPRVHLALKCYEIFRNKGRCLSS